MNLCLIDWFDVVPPNAYDSGSWSRKLTINPVTLQHNNPERDNGENLPQDWVDYVAAVIERSRKTRAHFEGAPHQLENA